jgi:hypothetical protein
MNRDLQQYLQLFTAEKQDEWVDWLPIAQFSYNTKKQASTQKSRFEVTRSYVPRMGFEQRITKAPAAGKKGQHMESLVHWKGYTNEDRTWEPKGNLRNTKAALDLFHERNPRVKLRMMFSEHNKLNNPYIDHLEVNP